MAPLFVHRFRKWRRRHAVPLVLRVLFAVAAGAALVAVADHIGEDGQGDGAAVADAPALPPAATSTASPGAEKLAERMEAAAIAEMRAQPDADLSGLPAFEVPPALRSIDGTSFRRGQDVIRIDGITGPAAAEICRDGKAPWACGLHARAALHNLVAGRSLFCRPRRALADGAMGADCELQPRDALPYGDVARLLVQQGWARPMAGREADFAAELGQAKAAGAGLWRGGWTIAAP